MSLHCPTCGAGADILINEQCIECGDAEIVEWVERLRPE